MLWSQRAENTTAPAKFHADVMNEGDINIPSTKAF